MVFGLPFLFIAVLGTGNAALLSSAAGLVLPVAVSSAFLTAYMLVWYSALAAAPVTLVSSILVFAPVVTSLLGAVFLKKGIIGQQIVTTALLTAGTALMMLPRLLPKRRDLTV
jgi:drug/metabolite transporter (DMT)-like permease